MDNDLRQLEEVVLEALRLVYKNDKHLIQYHCNYDIKTGRTKPSKKEYHVNERSIVFRCGFYLQTLLSERKLYNEYNLDCEYNRNGNQTKKIPKFDNGTYPDVILHKRGSNEDNVLVMEFKGYWCKDNDALKKDIIKLESFTNKQGTYKFSLGVFIYLGRQLEETEITMIIDGHVRKEAYLS